MKKLFLSLLALLPIIAFAQAIPEGDPLKSIADLILNWGTMKPLALGSSIIVVLVQLMKSELLGKFFDRFEYKRVLITILGQAYGVVLLVLNGSTWINAVVVGLITSGGAVAIWEALSPLLKKKA